MHQSGLLTLFIKTMWGLKMIRFSTPKVLAVGPNLRECWVGEKISRDNDVLRWGCCCRMGLTAIQKRMRSCWSLKGRRQIRTQFWPWYSRHVCRKFSSTGKRVDVLYEDFGYFLHSKKTESNSLIRKQLAHIFWYHKTFNKQRLGTMSITVLTAIFLRLLAIFPSGEKLIAPWNAMHSLRCKVIKTSRTKVELTQA